MPAGFRRLFALGLLYIAARYVISTFETTTSSFSKIVTNTYEYLFSPRVQYKHKQNHVEHWHVYRVNRDCPRVHMLVTHCPVAEPT